MATLDAVQHAERSDNAIQVSLDKNPTFYARIGKRMLLGSAEKPAPSEVVITGLGLATKIAIGAASIMEREHMANITKIETTYYTSSRVKKRLPKITIVVVRHPDMPDEASSDVSEESPENATKQ